MNNKVSVVIICHEKYYIYLNECLQSIFNQTIPADEIILIFDGYLNNRIKDKRW